MLLLDSEIRISHQIDRLYGYESNPRKDIWRHMIAQPVNTQMEFKDRYDAIVGEFAEQVT